MSPTLLLAPVLLILGANPSPRSAPTAAQPTRRLLRLEHPGTVEELRVGKGIPLLLSFEQPVKDSRVLLADPDGAFFSPQVNDRSVLLMARAEPPTRTVTTLSVALADGTQLPFRLVRATKEADLQVDVEVAFDRGSPASAKALGDSAARLRGELDECRAMAGVAGRAKVAALVLAEDPDSPQAMVAARLEVRALDKQSRLLVEALHAYRLFGHTYLVLSVENRDPGRGWVLDRAEVLARSGDRDVQLKVETVAFEVDSLEPEQVGRLVIAFETPGGEVGRSVTVGLLEKGGVRHVRLEGISP